MIDSQIVAPAHRATAREDDVIEPADRRRETRQPITARVRMWLFDRLAFIEGDAVDVSARGLGMEMPSAVPRTLLGATGPRRVEVCDAHGNTFSTTAEIRHAGHGRLGLHFDDPVPREFLAERG